MLVVVVILFVQLISLLDTPKLCVVLQYRLLTLATIACLFLSVLDTHHLKAGSSSILDATAYSPTSTGLAFFTSHRGSQEDVPSAHSTLSSHPFVVILGRSWPPCVSTVPWSIGIAHLILPVIYDLPEDELLSSFRINL